MHENDTTTSYLNEHAQYKRGLGRPENGARKNNSKPFGHALFVALHSRPNTKVRSYLQVGQVGI